VRGRSEITPTRNEARGVEAISREEGDEEGSEEKRSAREMIHFDYRVKNAVARYTQWRGSNPGGFVLNEGARWILHLAKCRHADLKRAGSLGAPKSCSNSIAKLDERARKNGQRLCVCVDCAAKEARNRPVGPVRIIAEANWIDRQLNREIETLRTRIETVKAKKGAQAK
jgi:hypothetical protein